MPATTGKQATARGLGIVRSLASAGKPAKQGPTATSMVAGREPVEERVTSISKNSCNSKGNNKKY